MRVLRQCSVQWQRLRRHWFSEWLRRCRTSGTPSMPCSTTENSLSRLHSQTANSSPGPHRSVHSKIVYLVRFQFIQPTMFNLRDVFRLCSPPPPSRLCPPPPSRLCPPQLQSTCPYIVNHYVKMWHLRLGAANDVHPLSLGAQTEKIQLTF